jgi:hypothetical protein
MVSRGRNAHRDEFFLVRKVEERGLCRPLSPPAGTIGRPHPGLRQDHMPFHSKDELEPPPLGEDAGVKYRNTQLWSSER